MGPTRLVLDQSRRPPAGPHRIALNEDLWPVDSRSETRENAGRPLVTSIQIEPFLPATPTEFVARRMFEPAVSSGVFHDPARRSPAQQAKTLDGPVASTSTFRKQD
jgi:hypothetical protein